jgi:hypothetical protein
MLLIIASENNHKEIVKILETYEANVKINRNVSMLKKLFS